MKQMCSWFYRVLACGILLVMLLPVRADAKNLEPVVTKAQWGNISSDFTVQFYEDGSEPNVLAAVYVEDQMYGVGFLEQKTGSEYAGTIFHKQLSDETNASLKLFFVEGEDDSYIPIRPEHQEDVVVEVRPEQEVQPAAESVLQVSCGPFTNVFSPFFSESANDGMIVDLTQAYLLEYAREGDIVLNGIDGETRDYKGTDYRYNGIADCTITEHENGTVDYDIFLREDVRFSDGVPLTADDVIFTLYVFSDPTYSGPSGFAGLPIVGMDEYRNSMAVLMDLLVEAGRDNRDFSLWKEATQAAFWSDLDQAGSQFCQEIVDYLIEAGYAHDVASAAAAWGYDWLAPDITTAEFFAAMLDVYGSDLLTLSAVESVNSSLFSFMERYDDWLMGVELGTSVNHIEGIQKTGEYSLRITLSEVDVTAVYQLAIPVAPLHHYGDVSIYDYENHQYGFQKGNLTRVRAQNTMPLGAGPYLYKSAEDGMVFLEANPLYVKGEPQIPAVCFRRYEEGATIADTAMGTVDVAQPDFGPAEIEEIKKCNSNGQLTGNNLITSTSDFPGYGYIGINAETVRVGTDSASEESKLLRRALATILAVHREPVIEAYYGERAHLIEYPISDTSWAAPRPTEPGYETAFSKDVYGRVVVTPQMSQAQKVEAAKQAATNMLLKAGYATDPISGKFVLAPEGAALQWQAIVPGDGEGDHPSYGILTGAQTTLKEMGLELIIIDPEDSNMLWDALDAGTAQIWTAAWGVTPDPDMHQVYHSSNITGLPGSSGSNHYRIADPELDQLIMAARSTTDKAARKNMYRQCLEIILDWGVEVPIFQRQECTVFSSRRIDAATIAADCTPYYGWLKEIHKLKLRSES